MFDPTLPDNQFLTAAKRLKEISANAKMLKFIIMMYDPQSPLVKEFPDLQRRREEAAYLSDFKLPQNPMKNDDLVRAIIGYLKILRNRRWALIVGIEQTIWESTGNMFNTVESDSGSNDKDVIAGIKMRNGMAADLIELNDKLDMLYKQFFNDEELEVVVNERPYLTSAESVAQVLYKLNK